MKLKVPVFFVLLFCVTVSAQLIPGPVNGFRLGESVLIYGDPSGKFTSASHVLLTHARRDLTWAAAASIRNGAAPIYPERERELFENPAAFWSRFTAARFHDYAQTGTKVPSEPIGKGRAVKGGDAFTLDALRIEVLDTPGYTPGAVSYLFEQGGRRFAATGDLIYGDGQLYDLYSLQDAVPEAKARGYHGYAARAAGLIASLRLIAARRPDVLIPARGPLITNPQQAIGKLIHRLQTVLRSHFSTDALRWYWGDDNLRIRAGKMLDNQMPDWMPMAEQSKLPEWVVPISNSRLILSRDGPAFLVDAGYRQIVPKLESLRSEGRFSKLEGLWITHYHDDHTDHAAEVARSFSAPVHFTARMREILEHPAAFRMPCLSTNPIRNQSPEPDGRSQRWHEFELTFFDFPGQTLYHGGLRVRKDSGETLFFAGDSFTPSGMDDYSLQNRNFLREGAGYLYCLNVLEREARAAWLINQHVEPMFRYTPDQYKRMREEIARRAEALGDLFPWPDLNFGIDESWARIYPYGTEAKPGEPVHLEVRIFNHSPNRETYEAAWNLPPGWKLLRSGKSVVLAPRTEGKVTADLQPAGAGLYIVTADVAFRNRRLKEWTEAMIEVR
ncbi:MAG: MBL fold metallo-hydrolase [Acidobacteriia bacterium]|nr:MBL fold metallo-hydrolase [Terriglobia bacterium]